jgi:hypothetical protein
LHSASLAIVLLLAVLAPPASRNAAAQTPTIAVGGRVIERGRSTPIAGATVEVRGVAERITDERGEFRFTDLETGTYTVRVRALGYQLLDRQLAVVADTTLTIVLDVDPVLLDSIRADARIVSLTGRVTDRTSGRAVADATVHLGPDREAVTNLAGRFRVRRIAEGYPTAVEVSALAYLPARLTVIPEEGRSIDIALEPDSVGVRMIERQVEKLHTRVEAIATSLHAIDRATLLRTPGWTARDVVVSRLPYNRRIQCLVIDERPFLGGDVRDVLRSFLAEEIERIEILGRGAMVRVYTRRFMQQMIRGARITHITWGFGGCA